MKRVASFWWLLVPTVVLCTSIPTLMWADDDGPFSTKNDDKTESDPAVDPVAITGQYATEAFRFDPRSGKPVAMTVELPPLPEGLNDPAFERYIDIRALGRAWAELDAGSILDAALQFAEGERVLFRTHKTLSADQMLRLALNVAVERRDKEVLERLQDAADGLGKEELAAQIQVAEKLMAEARSPSAGLSVDEFSAEEIAAFKAAQAMIRSAKLSAGKEALSEIQETLGELSGQVPEPMLLVLREEAEAALAAVEVAPDNAVSLELLDRLKATTRSGLVISPLSHLYGVPIWRDSTGRDWAFWGASNASRPGNHDEARRIIHNRLDHRWRLPTVQELRSLGWPEDHRKLGLRRGLLDFYWTSDPSVVMCPFGNGFQTAYPTRYRGSNYIIAVW